MRLSDGGIFRATAMARLSGPGCLVAGVVLALLLVVAPGAYDSPLGGPPLGAAGRAAVAGWVALCGLLFFFPVRRGPSIWLPVAMASFVAVKLLLGCIAVPHGWRAEYRFGDSHGATELARFFWRYGSHDYRVDRGIAFTAENFDLHFFNDVPAFGYPPYVAERREERFPLRVDWTGHVTTSTAQNVTLLVSSVGHVGIAVEGHVWAWDNPENVRLPLTLRVGSTRIDVTYTKPAGVAPRVLVVPLDAITGTPLAVTPAPSTRRWGASRVTSFIVLGGFFLLFLDLSVRYLRGGTAVESASVPGRAAGFGVTLLLAVWAGALALGAIGQTAFLHSGGDPLVYGSNARDILHHGWLMLQGRPLGDAEPFYFYPLYPYVLALAHALVGEDLSAIYLLNGLVLAVLPMLFWSLGWKRLSPLAAVVGFAALGGFLWYYGGPIVSFDEPVFPDFLFLTLVFLALVALSRAFEVPRPGRLVGAGALIAVAAATRPSLMTLIYLAPMGLWFAMRRPPPGAWALASGWLLGGVFIGLLPFTLRNLVAAGQFVVLVNSWIQIPYFLVPPEALSKPGGIPGLGQALVMARDIFVAHPAGTLWLEARKLVYTLGITAVGPAGVLQANGLSVLPPLFCVAIVGRRLRYATAVALVTFAVSHIGAMILAAPWTFHYKGLLPLHAVFLFGAAFLLSASQRDGAGVPAGALGRESSYVA